jgi:hypothetical protein
LRLIDCVDIDRTIGVIHTEAEGAVVIQTVDVVVVSIPEIALTKAVDALEGESGQIVAGVGNRVVEACRAIGGDRVAGEIAEARLNAQVGRIECVVVGGGVEARSILASERERAVVARQTDELLAGIGDAQCSGRSQGRIRE